MLVKYRQLSNNKCGLCAIKNLLYLYGINGEVSLKITSQGTSLSLMSKALKRYFFNVNVISFDIYELLKVEHFKPFIALIKNKDEYHYIVIYNKDENYLYILDSLRLFSYKLTYNNFASLFTNKAIIIENIKPTQIKKKNTLKNQIYYLSFLIYQLFYKY